VNRIIALMIAKQDTIFDMGQSPDALDLDSGSGVASANDGGGGSGGGVAAVRRGSEVKVAAARSGSAASTASTRSGGSGARNAAARVGSGGSGRSGGRPVRIPAPPVARRSEPDLNAKPERAAEPETAAVPESTSARRAKSLGPTPVPETESVNHPAPLRSTTLKVGDVCVGATLKVGCVFCSFEVVDVGLHHASCPLVRRDFICEMLPS
jgi:hypothetical protein